MSEGDHDRASDNDDDDGRPLTRTENRAIRKIIAQNAAGVLLTGYLGKFVLFLAGIATIVSAYLVARANSGHP